MVNRNPRIKRLGAGFLKAVLTLACLVPALRLHGTAYQELYSFPLGPANPHCELIEGPDGAFYGTTLSGGIDNAGTVFRVTTNGDLTTIATFTFGGTNGYHYEGRSWRGFHHHLVLAVLAYLFVTVVCLRAKKTSGVTWEQTLRRMRPWLLRWIGFCHCCGVR